MTREIDLSHKWATEIGRVFLAFGSIELCTHECLRGIPRDSIYDATSKMQLGPRIDLLLAVLKGSEHGAAVRLSVLLNRAKELSESRNLIAHNPLGLDVYMSDTGEAAVRESIRSLRNKQKGLTFDELVLLRAQCEDLANELYDAQYRFFAESAEAQKAKE